MLPSLLAGTRVLALPMSEATSLEYPNYSCPSKQLLYTCWECASDPDQDNHRTNRTTLPRKATCSGIYRELPCAMLLNSASSTGRLSKYILSNTSMLAFQTSARVLVLRVPLRFALQFC